MYCKNCGNVIESEAKFCGDCGNEANDNSHKNSINNETESKKEVANEKNLKGIAGWLIIVLLGLLYMGFSYCSLILSSIKYFTDGTIEKLSIIPGYAGALVFEICTQLFIVTLIAYIVFLFSKRSIKFPKYFIIFAILNFIFIAVDTYIITSGINYPTQEIKNAMQGPIQDSYTQLGRGFGYAVIWIWYMKVSKRVKLTFIEE